jgi:hypothetical protein
MIYTSLKAADWQVAAHAGRPHAVPWLVERAMC